jgi:hypothetical protein
MRITPEVLLKLAKDTVSNRARSERNLLAAYLQGSLLGEQPLLGNTADIDLCFIHNDEVAVEREIVRLTDEVHLDIAHHPHTLYRQPRKLRLHPWLGPNLYGCKILHDPQHFLDFTQASIRGQFFHPDNVLGRVRPQLEHARQIWMGFHETGVASGPGDALHYLRALEHAANAVAGLSGPPLTERRFLIGFSGRAEAVRRPGLYAGLLGLLGAPAVDAETLHGWLPAWRAMYTALTADQAPARLHSSRLPYYERAIEAILGAERPLDALWPLWHTWSLAANLLPAGSPQREAWNLAGERLGLLGAAFIERVTALDAYLDTVEEMLDAWARENGA